MQNIATLYWIIRLLQLSWAPFFFTTMESFDAQAHEELRSFLKDERVIALFHEFLVLRRPQIVLPKAADAFFQSPEAMALLIHSLPDFIPYVRKALSTATWDSGWGCEWYAQDIRQTFMGFQKRGGLRGNILDVGCSAFPVTSELDRALCRVIELDCAAVGESVRERSLLVRANIEDVFRAPSPDLDATEKYIGEFLGVSCASAEDRRQLDAVVFSQVLKYIDYQQVVHGILRYLKPGAELYVADVPTRTVEHLESPQGLKKTDDVLRVLNSAGFLITDRSSPIDDVLFLRALYSG